MTKYMINNLGNDYIYEADSSDEATLIYINEVLASDFQDLYDAIAVYETYMSELNLELDIYCKEVEETKNEYEISNIKFEKIEDNEAIIFTIKTKKGEAEFVEWIDSENKIERMDSHIRTNQIEDLERIFDLTEKPDLMNVCAYINLNEIIDDLQSQIS